MLYSKILALLQTVYVRFRYLIARTALALHQCLTKLTERGETYENQ